MAILSSANQKLNNSPQEIKEAIQKAEKIACTIDSRPDFDAFSSSMLMKSILERVFNKSPDVYFFSDYPKNIGEIIDLTDVIKIKDYNSVDFTKYDLIITTDSGQIKHITPDGNFTFPEGVKVLNIDHHEVNEQFGTYNYVISEYVSATEVIYDLLKKLKITPTKEEATLILLGILTDGGFYSYKTVTSLTFKDSAELVELGVNQFDLISKLNESESVDNIKFKKVVLNNLVINLAEKYAYSFYTHDELIKQGIDSTNVFIRGSDLIKYIEGIDVAFCMNDDPESPGVYTVSIRPKTEDIDANAIASIFGGGGHKVAAGAKVKVESLEDAIAKVLVEIKKYRENHGW